MVVSKNPVSCAAIKTRFPRLFIDSVGDLDRTVHSVAPPDSGDPDSMIFLATPKALTQGLDSPASVWVIPREARATAESKSGDRTLLIASNVELAMASVISEFFLKTPYTNRAITGVHPTAIVASDTHLATDVRIGPHAFIGSGVRLGSGVYIGAGSVIEDETEIGESTVVHPQVYIGHSTRIGSRCEIHPQTVIAKEGFGYAHDEKGHHYRIPHLGRVVLEDDVHIGGCCTIDRATFGETRIEAGTKFDNQIHIAHNCRIGRNGLVTAGFTMAGSSRIGANFITGGKTVVTGHITIGDNVNLAALSAVGKDIPGPGRFGGLPLLPLQQHLKVKAAMVQLPEIRKQLKRVMLKLGLESDTTGENDNFG